MTRLQIIVLAGGVLWVLFLVFMCLGARWNRENDEAALRLADRHHHDNDTTEGQR